jgi:hypothetical protein
LPLEAFGGITEVLPGVTVSFRSRYLPLLQQ